ncbi:hypothetical protein TetV_143 [Tetraselmis virus 1]|uniref:Uncharacterized protein n=1 Tax=Tetraselmis virus 1 TaxID=2060617 RepID=A0A2P0VMV0_9VIRU|nr:hypothetical protein QJ968_gp143 [Tetraselmis virus 1]AUF82235.1 hypothetical protein TetV_143 [Tetraselmis virus 1]
MALTDEEKDLHITEKNIIQLRQSPLWNYAIESYQNYFHAYRWNPAIMAARETASKYYDMYAPYFDFENWSAVYPEGPSPLDNDAIAYFQMIALESESSYDDNANETIEIFTRRRFFFDIIDYKTDQYIFYAVMNRLQKRAASIIRLFFINKVILPKKMRAFRRAVDKTLPNDIMSNIESFLVQ